MKHTSNAVELAKIYSAADVFVNLTYEDNYPTVNIEALACGTRVITYDTGGCSEAVHWSNVVETGKIQGVKELILSLRNENAEQKT